MRFIVSIIPIVLLILGNITLCLASPAGNAAASWVSWPIADAPPYTSGNAFFGGTSGGVDSIEYVAGSTSGDGFLVKFAISQFYLNDKGVDSIIPGLNEVAWVSLVDASTLGGSCSALIQAWHLANPVSGYNSNCWYDPNDPIYQPQLITPGSQTAVCTYNLISSQSVTVPSDSCPPQCLQNGNDLQWYYQDYYPVPSGGGWIWADNPVVCNPSNPSSDNVSLGCVITSPDPAMNYCGAAGNGSNSGYGAAFYSGDGSGHDVIQSWTWSYSIDVVPAVYGPGAPFPPNPNPPTTVNSLAAMQALFLANPSLLDSYRPAFAHPDPVVAPASVTMSNFTLLLRGQGLIASDLSDFQDSFLYLFGSRGDGPQYQNDDPIFGGGLGPSSGPLGVFSSDFTTLPSDSVMQVVLWGTNYEFDFAKYSSYFLYIHNILILVCTGYGLRTVLRSKNDNKI